MVRQQPKVVLSARDVLASARDYFHRGAYDGHVDGIERADRIDSDRLTALLTLRSARERSGADWNENPLRRTPDRVVVGRDGTVTLHYSDPWAAYSVRAGNRIAETRLRGPTVEHTLYSPSGRILDRAYVLRGDPTWN